MKIPSIFNPSNDMALAANVRQYLPPKRIQQMEADLADLARVWEGTRFAGPWGWSLATKQRYRQMGVADEMLPSDEWIAELRRLSSRETACRYIKDLLEDLNDERLLGSEMRWVNKENFDSQFSKATGRRAKLGNALNCQLSTVNSQLSIIFKSPWSSSGRGVFVEQLSTLNYGFAFLRRDSAIPKRAWMALAAPSVQLSTIKRLQGFLSSQGGFVMDRFYADKVLDFAMEFFVNEDHTVDFLGYSVFHASEHGAYGYNYVESQEELLRRIVGEDGAGGREGELLNRLIAYHKAHLSTLTSQLKAENAPRVGLPVGIDMLKTADGHIHPCLEINLRMNMGILALLLHEQYGSRSTVSLTPARQHGFTARVDEGKFFLCFQN